jgi:hypothetical protein
MQQVVTVVTVVDGVGEEPVCFLFFKRSIFCADGANGLDRIREKRVVVLVCFLVGMYLRFGRWLFALGVRRELYSRLGAGVAHSRTELEGCRTKYVSSDEVVRPWDSKAMGVGVVVRLVFVNF